MLFWQERTELFLAHPCGYAMNQLFIYLNFRPPCWLSQRDKVHSPWNIKARDRTSSSTENVFISFLFLFRSSSFYASNFLSVPTSQNTDILSRFPTINYQTIAVSSSMRDVVAAAHVGEARELYRWPCWPWKKKHMGFLISMRAFFFFMYRVSLPGTSSQRSSAKKRY